MRTTNALGAAMALCLIGAMAACGGGGGSDSTSSTQVEFTPAKAELTYYEKGQSLNPPTLHVSARVTNPPSGTVHVRIVQDKQVLHTSTVTAFRQTDGTYAADLPFETTLTAGQYDGTLTLQLCPDSACTSTYPLQGGTLPYSLTVLAGIQFTATVNGAAKTAPYALKDGDVLAVTANMPVSWTTLTSGGFAQSVTTTSTTWTGTVRYGVSTPGGEGALIVQALHQPTPQAQASLTVTVTQ